MTLHKDHNVVLLNGDTIVSGDWLDPNGRPARTQGPKSLALIL